MVERVFFIVFASIVFFILFREIALWYWRINHIFLEIKKCSNTLDKILDKMDGINTVYKRNDVEKSVDAKDDKMRFSIMGLDKTEVVCPFCENHWHISDIELSKEITCPKCKKICTA